MITQYLHETRERVRLYISSSAPRAAHRLSQNVYLIFNTKKGGFFIEDKTRLLEREIILKESLELYLCHNET
jgi:hypothetical protein